jgi:hypothetical protein
MKFPKNIKVAGIHFGEGRRYIEKYVVNKSRFELVREPENKFDRPETGGPSNAIAVKLPVRGGKHLLHIGYVPAKWAAEMAPLMDSGKSLTARFCYKPTGDEGQFYGLLIKVDEA